MLGLNAAEVARAVSGVCIGRGEQPISGVVTDSRAVRPGSLFVALPGVRTDGHRFLAEAQSRGAAAALVQPDRGPRPADLDVIVVPDTLAALGALARFHRARLAASVIGVTGTVGKTTAKDFLAALLGGPGAAVHAAPASFNSECGLPLAILAAPLDARFLVLEYGVNAPGEMERLLAIARPQHAWITALTEVHLEGMGERATIVAEKCKLARAVPEGGRIWLASRWADDCAEHARAWCGRVHWTGLHDAGGDAGGMRVLHAIPGAFRVDIPGLGEAVLPVVARHEAELAATAALAALELGAPPAAVAQRLTQLQRPPGRLQVHSFGPVVVLDDAYNASPASMEAALAVLAQWPRGGRRIAVLGTMHELGAAAERCHRQVGQAAAALPLDLVLCVGRGGAWIAHAAAQAGAAAAAVEDPAAAVARLRAQLQAGDVILLKASRAEGLERLLPELEAAARLLTARGVAGAAREGRA
ncbi:MAG: UDP-N-acetylmuramoyl-tripeptide--D-alanyl-D-alanine ligase [Planctomycetota bacterium]|nr:MAG: UDP-N-acetylmuramoyl-tripeptide--D-alanyl-D-alanine ligase [Planctomycetota bacterium]